MKASKETTRSAATPSKIATLCAVALLAVGCSSSDDHSTGMFGTAPTNEPTDFHSIAADLTPNMEGVYARSIDMERAYAIRNDLNNRLLADDFGRMWLFNHASFLSPYPIFDTSGHPH